MKNGNAILNQPFIPNFFPPDYDDAHSDPKCNGKFELVFEHNTIYSASALGPIRVPVIPFVACAVCRSAYHAPGFEEWIETRIASRLVQTEGGLTKRQIRFLRQFLDLTQQQLGDLVGIPNRQEMCRMESENDERVMPYDKQIRLKASVAEEIGIVNSDEIYKIIRQNESRRIDIDGSWFEDIKEG